MHTCDKGERLCRTCAEQLVQIPQNPSSGQNLSNRSRARATGRRAGPRTAGEDAPCGRGPRGRIRTSPLPRGPAQSAEVSIRGLLQIAGAERHWFVAVVGPLSRVGTLGASGAGPGRRRVRFLVAGIHVVRDFRRFPYPVLERFDRFPYMAGQGRTFSNGSVQDAAPHRTLPRAEHVRIFAHVSFATAADLRLRHGLVRHGPICASAARSRPSRNGISTCGKARSATQRNLDLWQGAIRHATGSRPVTAPFSATTRNPGHWRGYPNVRSRIRLSFPQIAPDDSTSQQTHTLCRRAPSYK